MRPGRGNHGVGNNPHNQPVPPASTTANVRGGAAQENLQGNRLPPERVPQPHVVQPVAQTPAAPQPQPVFANTKAGHVGNSEVEGRRLPPERVIPQPQPVRQAQVATPTPAPAAPQSSVIRIGGGTRSSQAGSHFVRPPSQQQIHVEEPAATTQQGHGSIRAWSTPAPAAPQLHPVTVSTPPQPQFSHVRPQTVREENYSQPVRVPQNQFAAPAPAPHHNAPIRQEPVAVKHQQAVETPHAAAPVQHVQQGETRQQPASSQPQASDELP